MSPMRFLYALLVTGVWGWAIWRFTGSFGFAALGMGFIFDIETVLIRLDAIDRRLETRGAT